MFPLAILVVLLAIGIPTLRVAARRFERRRIANGDWDSHGPKHPTKESRYRRFALFGNGLAFDQAQGIIRPEDGLNEGEPRPPDPLPPPPNDR